MPCLVSIGTAVPPHVHDQAEIWRVLHPGLDDPALPELYAATAIARRHSVLDDPAFLLTNPGTAARNQRYLEAAPGLAMEAIARCLERAGLGSEAVDLLVVVSCTGYEIPGLDLRLAAMLGMRADLRRTCVLGMGCYAALPGLARALDAVGSGSARHALVVAVELCSLHFQLDDARENVVASALFADGAAAALIAADGPLELVTTRTLTSYDTMAHMAFEQTDHGWRMRLSSYVPQLLALDVAPLVTDLLAPAGLEAPDVQHWVLHPGGRKILDHLQARLGLTDAQLAPARTVLRDHGNMSSPTVLFVLDELQRAQSPQRGDLGVMLAFGPGLTMEGALLRWR